MAECRTPRKNAVFQCMASQMQVLVESKTGTIHLNVLFPLSWRIPESNR